MDAIKKLDNYFSFSIYDADVIIYTPGIVIEASPDNSYKSWIEYKGKKPFDMVYGNEYGSFFNMGRIKVKGYNKTYQLNKNIPKAERDNKHLFRLEAETYASY